MTTPPDLRPLAVPGAWKYEPVTHHDNRGSFTEWFRDDALRAATGRSLRLMQANVSVSRRGALRGIAFTDMPPGQTKGVTCVSGAVLDVVVDLRQGSPTFRTWHMERLDEDNHTALVLSEGLAHAFLSLEDGSALVYLLSEGHDPAREHCVHPLDPDIGIRWPADIAPVLSAKDAAAPSLRQAMAAGVLPQYAACTSV
ncbi:dTDP-4-dehydrorhamnose 3,5-epimerase family protein [Streptomyces rhizosphaerihabitans]|uniref:dTDP-4-dehydrorhamnose 3,5-epimerase family protein n=1 Tax=Streptomyces rhizosphaerihabitans TaxID=1266770 RepID=UPI0028F6E002|nr:dTDP-4-dehydrorhamnose 3,5-epimerase family protein [Streptomyces rhizosphaerihabitans]